MRCCWYHKGTNFQANHNVTLHYMEIVLVVADTTKVRIFKQITTELAKSRHFSMLLLIPQRYEFSSKSQLHSMRWYLGNSCCWYHKGTNFQANHNFNLIINVNENVVADTTKVRIFKQITTDFNKGRAENELLLIPQRYEFSSKSQLPAMYVGIPVRCCWYHKGTNFQANHNRWR